MPGAQQRETVWLDRGFNRNSPKSDIRKFRLQPAKQKSAGAKTHA